MFFQQQAMINDNYLGCYVFKHVIVNINKT